MTRLIALALVLWASVASAAPPELPDAMLGYWGPHAKGPGSYPDNYPGMMQRLPHDAYEWIVFKDAWVMWDGYCQIHDVKQIGDMDYEVGAMCGMAHCELRDKKCASYSLETDRNLGDITDDRFQFTLCGEYLTIRQLTGPAMRSIEAQPMGCKLS